MGNLCFRAVLDAQLLQPLWFLLSEVPYAKSHAMGCLRAGGILIGLRWRRVLPVAVMTYSESRAKVLITFHANQHSAHRKTLLWHAATSRCTSHLKTTVGEATDIERVCIKAAPSTKSALIRGMYAVTSIFTSAVGLGLAWLFQKQPVVYPRL